MRLSKRLERVVANVKSGGVVADVGCDHGYTSICLVQRGLAAGAIAMDVNRGPLERAAEHIARQGLGEKIQLRLSDGLEKLEPGEAATILISGLGGALMSRILERGRKAAAGGEELVLSPQSEIWLVRRQIHQLGFAIAHEEMVEDQGKYYVIIRGVPGGESYREEEYIYGRRLMQERDPVFLVFLGKELERLEQASRQMSRGKLGRRGQERMRECQEKQDKIRELLHKIEY